MWADMRGTWRSRKRRRRLLWPTMICAVACAGGAQHSIDTQSGSRETRPPARDWPVYGGQKADDHYSPLTQINRGNVGKLAVAWSYDTGEKGVGLQTSPLIVGRALYAYTPTQKVIALDAATGKLLWSFDSGVAGTQPVRGLTPGAWAQPPPPPPRPRGGGDCSRRSRRISDEWAATTGGVRAPADGARRTRRTRRRPATSGCRPRPGPRCQSASRRPPSRHGRRWRRW